MTSIIITLLIVFYRIPLINILGDKGMGYYSTALVIYLLFMTCIAYGLPKAVSTLLETHCSKGQYKLVYKTAASSLIFSLISGGILFALLFLGADFIASNIMNAGFSAFSIRAIAPCILFVTLFGALQGIFTGTRMTHISKIAHHIHEIGISVLSIVFAYVFTDIGTDAVTKYGDYLYESAYSAMGASLGLTLGVFISLIFLLFVYMKWRKKFISMANKDTSEVKQTKQDIIKQIVKTMIPFVFTLIIFHISSFTDYAIFNRIMKVQGTKESSYMILLGMLNGKYEFYISLPLLLVNWIATSKVPQFHRIIEEGNKRKVHNKISQTLRYTMLFVIPCTLLYLIYAKQFMNLFFTGINDTPALMLRMGAISIVFYSLAAISNAVLEAMDDWALVGKNAMIALVVQIVCLLILMIIFQWGIFAVVVSRIIFSGALFVLNEHTLREQTGYIQEKKRTFKIPTLAACIMAIVSFVIYLVLNIMLNETLAFLITLAFSVVIYVMALVFLGGITQREMYHLPGGKFLAPLCRKLHLIH